MDYTAKALSDANEEPALTIGRFRYIGRLLSAPEWFTFWDRYLDLAEQIDALKTVDEKAKARALVKLERASHTLRLDYLRAVFPKHRFRWWAPDPVKTLEKSHPRAVREAFDAFFSLQARAMGSVSPEIPTDGTDSPPRTPDGATP